MKKNFTLKCTVLFAVTIFFSFKINVAKAQLIAPAMVYANSQLVSGIDGQINATYKFPSVTPGVDAYITILDIAGGATLTSIDDNTFGYSAAWQPVVKTPSVQGACESYVSFSIQYKDSADGLDHTFDYFVLSFIDVDGDNQHVREFVATKDFDSYSVSNITALILTEDEGLTKATGPILNYEGIDTSSYQTNINFKFKNRDRIREVRVGNKVDSIFTPQDRYSCGYFQNVNIPFLKVLTVKYLSFEAVVNNKIVDVKWVTNSVQNNAKFEVERSFDMNHFKMIGTVTNIVSSTEANISYKLSDVSKESEENTIVYYRLKQINLNGTWNYSKVISVELKPKIGIKMNVSPNPFVEDIHVHLSTSQSSIAEIRIISTSGQKKISKQFTVNKGESNIEIGSLNKLAMGLYVAQVIVNGTVIGNQQIIKN